MTKIIADACCNHLGDMRIAEAMVKAAASVGVDICKFQAFSADKLNPAWPDYEQARDYYRKLQFGRDEFKHLKEFCEDSGVEFLCTAFDVDAAKMIASLGCRTVKIGSPDCGNWPLIDECLDHFHHVIISVGMATESEFTQLTNFVDYGNLEDRITVLHCVSEYPLPLAKVNMSRMLRLKDRGIPYGFSDHTQGTEAAKLAICLGAAYVEKHLTLSRCLPGKDQQMSTTPEEFDEIVRWRNQVQMMMRPGETEVEPANRQYIGRWQG